MAGLALPAADQKTIVDAVTDLVRTRAVAISDFIRAYNEHRSIEHQSPRFAVLDVENGGEMQAVPAALNRALQEGFFIALWSSLLERLTRPLPADPRLASIPNVVGSVGPVGTMQSVLRIAGLRNVATLPSIVRVARATALISAKVPGRNEKTFGTGFLVSPTLLLTAAHVVEPLIEEMKERAGSTEDASILFHNQLEGPGQWPVKARLAPQWLVCMSPPNGSNGKLALDNVPDAAQKLDFALIQLSEPVGNVTGTVDVTSPPDPEVQGRLTVIGYEGGSACVLDDHVISELAAEACRIHHGVNTVSGMSGGPCIDSEGRAVGLHEGSVTAVNPEYNRAVSLKSVREFMRRGRQDPLLADTGPLRGISDREARRAWIAAGEALLGTIEAQRLEWLDSVAHFNPDDPRGGTSTDIFHPVFGRQELQDWISDATLGDSMRRIALLSGLPGSGKSFSGAILRHRVRGAQHHIVQVPPSVAKRPIAEVVEFIVTEAGGQNPPSADSVLRPSAGVVRRDLLPECFNELSAILRARSGESALLWIFVDVGEDSALTGDTSRDWKEFVIEAEKHAWVRLLMVGLSNTRRGEFRAAAAKPEKVESKSVVPITADEFLDSIKAQAEAFHLDPRHWSEESSKLWDDVVEPLAPNQGRSVLAVRLALEIRMMMTEAAEAASG
jgi:V8-like Glu-specific endopeptidase